MKVIIIRHFKVKHTWKKRCSSAEFDEDCRLYDKAPTETGKSTAKADIKRVYVSILDRSVKTATEIFGEGDFCRTGLINEVPLKSAFDSNMRFPLWFWNVLGRLQWFFNCKRQKESRRETKERADKFIRKLIKRDEDSAIVTHGFFMHTLIPRMKHCGFKAAKTGIHYDNGDAVILWRN